MKLPRLFYWIAGIVVALIGVGVARLPGGEFAETYQLPLLLTGTVIVFIGLWIVTKGTGTDEPPTDGSGGPTAS